MNKETKESYQSPEVEIMETKVQNVICTSQQDAGNNGYNSNDYAW